MKTSIKNTELLRLLDNLLEPHKYQDYCPNGLQIEGKSEIKKIITGVSLSDALIEEAIKQQADAIIVHHGIFWNKAALPLTGIKGRRVAKLIKHDINLYAYHLPLDNHVQYGNNMQLAKLLQIVTQKQVGSQGLLWIGQLANATSLKGFIQYYTDSTKHTPLVFGKQDKVIQNIAWCTGGADSMFEEAIVEGVDLYITGEASEPIMSLADESGVAFMAGGHYITEQYGVIALTEYLQNLEIDAQFVRLYNPV